MMSFQRLLYMCELPPSTSAGAPIIVRQLLRQYDMSRLDILCCERYHELATPLIKETYLPCSHTRVPSYDRFDARPRRVFRPIIESLNCRRVMRILAHGRDLVRKRQIEAIFTAPWRCEFALAAYFLHCETGLPLYVFEMDDWEAMNPHLVPGHLTRKYHRDLLTRAKKLWLTSPAMVRKYEDRFDVKAEFLFHFVDVERYVRTSKALAPQRRRDRVSVVYTGAINIMFYDTLKAFCNLLNDGIEIDNRPVHLSIYTPERPVSLLGPRVEWAGFVKSDEIPHALAMADLLLICVSFSQDPRIVQLVTTSLYTKTIDYLASERPVLVISPRYSAEADYFGRVTSLVDSLDPQRIVAAIDSLARDTESSRRLCEQGLEMVRRHHSLEALDRVFLSQFFGNRNEVS
jgi:glycosyltransferase involved in cell wall biosynthesis